MDINQKMQDAFNAQITEELFSSNLYLQMAFWFRKEGWIGFAKWMAHQSDEEKRHAMDMADFVLNRGGKVELKAVPSVQTEWKDPKDVFESAMAHEKHVSALISKLADVADDEKDRAAANFCDKYVDEQVEEEKSLRDILNLFRHREGSTIPAIDDIVGGRQY
ncbi:MAG: ferritin [Prevotella sp.]|nr:ferritin [Prevotella sp.]